MSSRSIEDRRRLVAAAVLLLVSANILAIPAKVLYLISQRRPWSLMDGVLIALAMPAAAFIVWLRARTLGQPNSARLVVQSGLLLATCTGAGFLSAAGFANSGDAAAIGSTIVLAAAWLPVVKMWAARRYRATSSAPGMVNRPMPAPGEVWFAEVPFADVPGAKDRPCLVIRTFPTHVQVLKVTSTNKAARPHHIPIRLTTGASAADRDSWLELLPPRVLPYSAFRRYVGPCDNDVWYQVAQLHGTSRP